MAQIDSLPEGLGSSMQRDVNAGKPSEIDAIAGAVIRSGKKHGLECPTIEKLIILIKSRGKS
jgi:2-dehydropantoate 2-reductase